MVKVIDKRPTNPQDSLRRLLDGIKTPASVPHGIKVAGPNDYVSFMDSSGVSHRWDGDAIATYNARLAEAEVAMAEAKVELEAAQAELDAAKERIGAASGDLTAYIEKVEAAQAKADAVQASFEGVAGELDDVAAAVEAVKARTSTVEGETGRLSGAVENALAEASAASSLASEAGDKAQAAAADAARVQALAQNAATAAEEAERKALEAAGVAASKGKVIYGGTAPVGADATAENLWIRSSDNRPHRWDGTRWVEVTDAAVVAAAGAASAAQATADRARADAAAAQAAAVTADGKAAQAITAAQAAQGTADKAVSDAAKAQAAASAADKKALDAAGLAGSKGKVIYSSTAPTGADRVGQNLWIRTTDNRPHRWSGSAWVAVTDKVATDAAASAAAANSLAAQAKAAADKAQADATSAASAAQDAMRAANQAQDSANGKNTVSYTTGTPAGVGTRLGDTHYQVNAAGTVLRWWRWSGSAWVEQALDGQVISSLDAGKITAGTLDAARIKAGSITANKLMVGIGPNLFPPLSADHLAGAMSPPQWRVDATGGLGGVSALVVKPAAAQPGTYPALALNAGVRVESPYCIPVQPGQQYRVSVWVKGSQASTGSQTAAVFGRIYGEAGGTTYVWASPSSFRGPITTGWTQLVGFFTIPEDTGSGVRPTRLVVGFYTNGSYPGECWFSAPEVMAMTPGDLIVNGSITGEKVNAQSVAAAVGTFVKVNAENVGVSGELAARMVSAMSAQTKNLVVTESAILQHTTLLGTTVAEQLNVTKKLVARNAIVDGTLDVAQLNVTEQMAAEIVNAMSVNTKKLVVSEEAIMNQLTVIQNIVTPELVAERINVKNLGAALVTAGALQTDDAANRGVKITSTGYKAYDGSGNLTVDLNGTSNLIRGEFATDSDPKVGVKLLQKDFLAAVELYPRNKLTDSSHGAVWYDGYSRGSEQGLCIAATRNAAVKDADPGILLKPALGVGFQGKFSRDSPALKTGVLEAQSAPAGGWNNLEMNFARPFAPGASIAVFLSPINENKTEVAYAIQNATTTGFKAVIKNVSTRATGYQWIKYLAIAI